MGTTAEITKGLPANAPKIIGGMTLMEAIAYRNWLTDQINKHQHKFFGRQEVHISLR